MLGTILIVLLVLVFLGVLRTWGRGNSPGATGPAARSGSSS